VKLYDAATAEILAEMDASDDSSGDWLWSWTYYDYNRATQAFVATLLSSYYGCRSVVFSPYGGYVATGNARGEIRLWTAEGQLASIFGGQYRYREGMHRGGYRYLGEFLAITLVATPPNRTSAIDDGPKPAATRGRDSQPRRMEPDEQDGADLIAAADDNGMTRLWNTEGKLIRTWVGAAGMRGWPRKLPPAHTRKFVALPPPITSLAFSPDWKTLACGRSDGKVYFWDVRTGRRSDRLDAYNKRVDAIAFSPDGRILATIGYSEKRVGQVRHSSRVGHVKLWDLQTGKEKNTLNVPLSGTARCLAYLPDGTLLASGHGDGRIIVWNVAEAAGQPAPKAEHETGLGSRAVPGE